MATVIEWTEITTTTSGGGGGGNVEYLIYDESRKDPRNMAGKLTGSILIPGTDLFTNVYYTIDLKSSGRLTWTYNCGLFCAGYNVDIVYNSVGTDYAPGAKYFEFSKWKFVAASEAPGYYKLVNKGMEDGVVTTEGGTSMGRGLVIIPKMQDSPDYDEGGCYRDTCLFRFELDESDSKIKYYRIYNKQFPDNGIITWINNVLYTSSKPMQVCNGALTEEQKHSDDYLWRMREYAEGE